jgi:hypothetical protein
VRVDELHQVRFFAFLLISFCRLTFVHLHSRYVPVGLLERFPIQMNERAFPFKGRDELEVRPFLPFFPLRLN